MGFNTFPCNPYPISTEELNKGNNDDLNTRVTALEGDVSDLEEQKANQITIALSFNPETTYNPGDLVYYNGLTYRCTNEHTGEWDADDFAGTTIANELSELKSGLIDVNVALDNKITISGYSLNAICISDYTLTFNNGSVVEDLSSYVPSDYKISFVTAAPDDSTPMIFKGCGVYATNTVRFYVDENYTGSAIFNIVIFVRKNS